MSDFVPSELPCDSPVLITGKKINCNPHPKLFVKKLTADAILPSRGSERAAGYDLSYSRSETITIPPQSRALVPIDIAIDDIYVEFNGYYASPRTTYYLRIAPRSGLALKHGIDVGAGVVDQDYRGPIGVVLFNFGDKEFVINKGDRIAQLIIEMCEIFPVEESVELSTSVRGSGGFGSTGK
jgi:dUTP pyrophosphatase